MVVSSNLTLSNIALSSNGRTSLFGGEYLGSNPSEAANFKDMTIEQLFEDVTIRYYGLFEIYNNCLWIKDPDIHLGRTYLGTTPCLLFKRQVVYQTDHLPRNVLIFLKPQTLIYLGETDPLPSSY